jgi:hypothetical protein
LRKHDGRDVNSEHAGKRSVVRTRKKKTEKKSTICPSLEKCRRKR